MKLHLTFNGKWIDSVSIDPLRRRDQEYLENKKLLLKFRHKQLFEGSKLDGEFYLDPLYEDDLPTVLQVPGLASSNNDGN